MVLRSVADKVGDATGCTHEGLVPNAGEGSGYSRSVSDFCRLTKPEKAAGPARRAASGRVCNKPCAQTIKLWLDPHDHHAGDLFSASSYSSPSAKGSWRPRSVATFPER